MTRNTARRASRMSRMAKLAPTAPLPPSKRQPPVGPCHACGDPYGAPLVDPFVAERIVEERGPPPYWCRECYTAREDEV